MHCECSKKSEWRSHEKECPTDFIIIKNEGLNLRSTLFPPWLPSVNSFGNLNEIATGQVGNNGS